ncbi:DUF2922 domain-containing protein [Niallia sp. Sow4_A1]|jgi:hypothetical protein|uniref:DUF2922 domain-containing protein n=1 Tax=Niallia hominis TaxID=3133173 RepID=A0ABV1F4F1_9BACI|nr:MULTISPECIES: DUF2922 family protein [Bacillaceae]MCF2647491.1 DUF2922 domain-containing protein [Niallia circulans]MCM3364849.1 DUF2922 domain-containing protein [Niallia sp. MER TA 168]CAI9385850.1 hypothetical protein BACSP_01411 [Bacillus sp. T2.9-1]
MAKSLELTFETSNGKSTKISLESPVEPVDAEQVSTVMQSIISANALSSANGELIAVKGIRLVERNVTDYEI